MKNPTFFKMVFGLLGSPLLLLRRRHIFRGRSLHRQFMPETILINIASENQAKNKSDFGKDIAIPVGSMWLADLPNTFIWFFMVNQQVNIPCQHGAYGYYIYTHVFQITWKWLWGSGTKNHQTQKQTSPHSIHVWYILLPIFTYIHEKPFKKATIHVGWCRFPLNIYQSKMDDAGIRSYLR